MGAAYLAALVAATVAAVWWIRNAWDAYQDAKHAYLDALESQRRAATRLDPPVRPPAVRLVDWQKESWA